MKSPMIKKMKQLTVKVERTTPWYLELLGIFSIFAVGYALTVLAFCI